MNKDLLQTILPRLERAYGRQTRFSSKTPIDQLIATILSQRTNYADELLAYNNLRDRYPTWEEVAAAPVEAIERLIRSSRFPEVKAPRIVEVLRRIIDEHGSANLDFLQGLSTEEALAYLMALPGVGFKTATFVLLFTLRKPVLPEDTHIHRVTTRTGILTPKTSLEKAHIQLLQLLPPDPAELLNFHKLFFHHGQKVCTFSFPRCRVCIVSDVCDYYGRIRKGEADPKGG
jgi:endonuclease-3